MILERPAKNGASFNIGNAISMIKYHFVFCPRYRRKIFLIENVEERFKILVNEKCEELEISIIEIICDKDHCYMYLDCPPTLSPSDIMLQIKNHTSKYLREEFIELSKMHSLWTKKYFVSTEEDLSKDVIQEYVNSQRKRY